MHEERQRQIRIQIGEQKKELQELYERLTANTAKQEEALCACVFYVARLLDEILQMSVGDMEYEQQIFCGAMTIFVEQFILQVESARSLEGNPNTYEYVVEKRNWVEDIENAVEKVLTAYRNMIDSMANMDRHMLIGLTAGVNAYDLSPKLCAAYSYILNRLTKLMEGEGSYAFLLNPTTKSIVRSEALLEYREEHGKVVIINMPERMMERSDILPVILIHEAYHVLTLGESRLRCARAQSYLQNMYYEIINFLFQGTALFHGEAASEEETENIREKLMEMWFSDGKKALKDYLNGKEDSRQFYGKNMTEKVQNCIEEDLKKLPVRLEEDIMGCFFETMPSAGEDLKPYEERYKKVIQDIETMTKNLHAILCGGVLDAAKELFLFMYREVYSDLACVMLLDLKAERYDQAFEWSMSSRMPEFGYVDNERLLRQYLVAEAYSGQLNRNGKALSGNDTWEGRYREWKVMADENCNRIRNLSAESGAKKTLQAAQHMIECKTQCPHYPEGICLTEEILDNLCGYFEKVAEEFAGKIKGLKGVASFREATARLMQISSDDKFREQFLLDGIKVLENGEGAKKKEDA